MNNDIYFHKDNIRPVASEIFRTYIYEINKHIHYLYQSKVLKIDNCH